MSFNARKVLAPIFLAILLVVFLNIFKLFPPHIRFSELWYTVAMTSTAIISVLIAYKLWPSSPFTVAVVLILVLIVRETLLDTLLISWYAGGDYWGAFIEAVKHFHRWHRVVLPLVSGVAISYALKHLTHRSSRDRANSTDP